MKVTKARLEAFSDGVVAIIITIMVLNIPLPDEPSLQSIVGLLYAIVVFFVSFIVVGAQWSRHHLLFDGCQERISQKIIWHNFLYLFFLSLLPIFTKWIMENPREVVPAISYDLVFLTVFIFFHLLQNSVIREDEDASKAFQEIRKVRGKMKHTWLMFGVIVLCMAAIFGLSFFYPTVSIIFFIGLPVVSSLFNLWNTGEGGFAGKKKSNRRKNDSPKSSSKER